MKNEPFTVSFTKSPYFFWISSFKGSETHNLGKGMP